MSTKNRESAGKPPADVDPAVPTEAPAAPASLLPGPDLAAWRGFVTTHPRLVRRLDAEMTTAHGMALVEYEVLFNLSRADGRLRMSQLAERATLSRSGLSRVVDVLEQQRLVRRRADAADGRAVVATLTPLGRERLQIARRSHSATVRRLVLDPLSDEQKATLAAVWSSIEEQLDRPTGSGGHEESALG